MVVVYPGSFDPVTYGHLDIIKRCSRKFEKVIVVVMNNSSKKYLFSLEERQNMIRECLKDYDNIEVDHSSGLLVDYLHDRNVNVLVKGLRALSDFEFEFQMALMNNCLDSDIETFFLMTSNRYSFVSSSMVKEIAKYEGDISNLVPDNIRDYVMNRIEKV
ncbi:MAG: pantetheine-phosphate adenylyltransferase [Tissierellales bacterium]|jgi:pantetheine-phosphate adenylyltransferase|nr:pantetheine-phosphate adenylyltransferase [Tissierellales bacterium]